MTTTEPRDPHERKCWDCGNIAIHENKMAPWVLCKKCGSQDTRATKPPPPTREEELLHTLRNARACLLNLQSDDNTAIDRQMQKMVWEITKALGEA